MTDEDEAKMQPIPGWAPQILKQELRDMRYNGLVMQGSHDEHLRLLVRRADKPIGTITLEHWVLEKDGRERHDIRIVFEGGKGEHFERFTPHSIKQMEEFSRVLVHRICKYGMSVDRRWCDDCTDAERHKEGRFEPSKGPSLHE